MHLVAICPLCPDQIGIWKCWFWRRGENQSTRKKTSQSKDENQQQTQCTYDTEPRNRTLGPFLETPDNFPGPVSIFLSSFIYQLMVIIGANLAI